MKSEIKSVVKHTVGPWKLISRGIGTITPYAVYDGSSNGYLVSKVVGVDSDEETHANARLIAAAPELLEACKALLEEWKSRTAMIESCDLTEGEDRAVEIAESAIAKATGETMCQSCLNDAMDYSAFNPNPHFYE